MEFRLNTLSVSRDGNAARPSISSLCWARSGDRELDQRIVICQRSLPLVYAPRRIDLVLITLLSIARKSTFTSEVLCSLHGGPKSKSPCFTHADVVAAVSSAFSGSARVSVSACMSAF